MDEEEEAMLLSSLNDRKQPVVSSVPSAPMAVQVKHRPATQVGRTESKQDGLHA